MEVGGFRCITSCTLLGSTAMPSLEIVWPKNFTLFSIELMVPKTLENNAQVLSMVFLILGIDKDVINENHDELVKLRHEYRVHEIHEVGRSICETKRHD